MSFVAQWLYKFLLVGSVKGENYFMRLEMIGMDEADFGYDESQTLMRSDTEAGNTKHKGIKTSWSPD